MLGLGLRASSLRLPCEGRLSKLSQNKQRNVVASKIARQTEANKTIEVKFAILRQQQVTERIFDLVQLSRANKVV